MLRPWHCQQRLEWLGLLEITTKCIGKHHLPRTLALRFEQGWTSYKHRNTTCAGDRHIQPIGTVEKLHATRSIRRRRGCHGIKNDRCFLSLEFVDGHYMGSLGERSEERRVRKR